MGNGKSGFNCENNLCAYWTWLSRNKIRAKMFLEENV